LSPTQELHAIEAGRVIPFRPQLRGLHADVLLGVRHRQFAPEKNWQHWPEVARAVTQAGYTFAVVGHKTTSFDLPGQQFHTGDYDTDAAIELMKNCRLYVGTDSGNTHLAATVNCPILAWRIPDARHRDLFPRMREVATDLETVPDGWTNPPAVISAMLKRLRQG
jgi:hypothetical protein